jgi:hypothetical protein
MLLIVLGVLACTKAEMHEDDSATRLSRPTQYRLFEDYGTREADF